jgi:hypothetical protein
MSDAMKTNTTKTTVKGGWIARETNTGQFVAVKNGTKISKNSNLSKTTIKGVSNRRSAALKRLADR